MNYTDVIRNLRMDCDYTQAFVAKHINVSQRAYSDYETGRNRMPVESLIALAQLYNVDMNYLLGISKLRREFPKK